MRLIWNNQKLIRALQENGVAVMPTDTLYGIVGKAENPAVVERIYKIKKRSPNKKLIILIPDWNDTKKFGIDASKFKIPKTDAPTSFILDDVAFREPLPEGLRQLLRITGPLVAPSANPEGLPPAKNITEAKKYFGDLVDMYADGGEIGGKVSKVVKLHKDGSISIIRE